MKPMKRLLSTGLPVALLLASGCGQSDEQQPRFNQTLGDTPAGAPVAPGPIDTGILQDPASYTPTAYEPLEGEPAAEAATVAEGADPEAIRAVFDRLADALSNLEFATALDAFVPEQVAAITGQDEYLDNLDGLSDALTSFGQVVRDKAPATEGEPADTGGGLSPEFLESLHAALAVSVVDEDNAVATFDLSKVEMPAEFRDRMTESIQANMAMMAQLGLGGPSPGSAEPPPQQAIQEAIDSFLNGQHSVPLRKVDDAWRISLPWTLEEQHAELINEAVVIVKEAVNDLAQGFGQVETLDDQTAAQIAMQVAGRHVPAIMGWVGRAQFAFASLIEDQQPPEEEAAEAQTDEEQPEESEETSEEEPGRRPGRRSGPRP
jgi:hypothetical protein